MGCFSWICPECDRSIRSSSFDGQHCILFLLEEGKILEYMQGQYDSYGRVFDERGESIEWATKSWNDIVDLEYNGNNQSGIAAYHSRCFKKGMYPKFISKNDPNQGWDGYTKSKRTDSLHVIGDELIWNQN